MQSFIHRRTLDILRKQLAETNDGAMRDQLEILSSEEEAKPAASGKRGEKCAGPLVGCRAHDKMLIRR